MKSTYTSTASCATVEEGEDRFTLRYKAPGNRSILAIWVTGTVKPSSPLSHTYKPGKKACLRNIASDAPRVFGQQIEWRLRAGMPCAAIVRVYSTKAGILAVSDLSNGKRLGDA
ncbi:hypothetical protein [Brucella intermedia]|uniref:hypothetical protein n=1 Tax=Brucella intermedia TaxID=94625 RepID=UPI00124C52D5|nr:hypothetical protein [Brucella intermedia]KAB2723296.1 hypothetical protein F9L02_22650 [Brucella intermedia]